MDWMGELPQWMRKLPLSKIAIPGSHDSGTYLLNGPFAPDLDEAKILNAFSCIARPIAHRWSKTQTLSFFEQLQSGIRYFDLRISSGPSLGEYSIVHGLYGPDIRECLNSVSEFSLLHPTEVIIIDLNHFYAMNQSDHQALLQIIFKKLGNILVKCAGTIESLTLESLWNSPSRVICIYQNEIACSFLEYVWPSPFIVGPWPDVTDRNQLIDYLQKRYERGPNPSRLFYNTLGILTPTTNTILRHFKSSLSSFMSIRATADVVNWIRSNAAENWYNIIIVDFVETSDFINNVILLNYSKKALHSHEMIFVQ